MLDKKVKELQKQFENLSPEQLEQFLMINGLFQCWFDTPMYVESKKSDSKWYDSVFEFTDEKLELLVEEINKKYSDDTERYLVIPFNKKGISIRQLSCDKSTYKAIANVAFGDGLILVNEEREERTLKLLKQQQTEGFNDSQLWNLDATIAKHLLPKMIARFKDITNSHPADLTAEEWDNVLAKLIWYADQVVDDNGWYPRYSREDTRKYLDDMEECAELFAKYFRDLWD